MTERDPLLDALAELDPFGDDGRRDGVRDEHRAAPVEEIFEQARAHPVEPRPPQRRPAVAAAVAMAATAAAGVVGLALLAQPGEGRTRIDTANGALVPAPANSLDARPGDTEASDDPLGDEPGDAPAAVPAPTNVPIPAIPVATQPPGELSGDPLPAPIPTSAPDVVATEITTEITTGVTAPEPPPATSPPTAPAPTTVPATTVPATTAPPASVTPTTVPATNVVVDFGATPPPGPPWDGSTGTGGELDGVFAGIDFGNGMWRWETARPPITSNQIFFTDSSRFDATIEFADGPRHLVALTVWSDTGGRLTLTDDRGQTAETDLAPGATVTFEPAWTDPSAVVTIAFSNGWELGIATITHR